MTNTLQTLILNRLSELGDKSGPLPYRQAAARSGIGADGRPRVSHATLHQIASGKHSGRIDDDTAAGIALSLDVPLSTVREAAQMGRDAPTEFRLPPRANNLTAADRRAIMKVVDALLEAHTPGT